MSAGSAPFCKECGHILYGASITAQERKRREKERTTYCANCDLIVYAVPIESAINTISRETAQTLYNVKNPSKWSLSSPPQMYKRDRRYRSGYRMTDEGEEYCCQCVCILILIGILIAAAFYTFGIALVVLIPIYYYYNNQSKQKHEVVQNIQHTESSIVEKLNQMREEYQYVCRRCFSGVKLKNLPKSEKKVVQPKKTLRVIYCELCASKNENDGEFCVNCGSKLKL